MFNACCEVANWLLDKISDESQTTFLVSKKYSATLIVGKGYFVYLKV